MLQLIFATGNPHKVKEVFEIMEGRFPIGSMSETGFTGELPETQSTIEGNAIQKARYLYDHYHVDCFAEDTGLEIDALHGEPGVFSARYAGEGKDADANTRLVLEKLGPRQDRSARFRTVIALVVGGVVHTFEGVAEGKIGFEKRGEKGFGYDPIFIPEGYDLTFAEIDAVEKNQISHRSKALAGLKEYLQINFPG